MKFSVSVSEEIANALCIMVVKYKSNPSAVVESALALLGKTSDWERRIAIRDTHLKKKALTLRGWMAAFWTLLAEEFGTVDFGEGSLYRVAHTRTYEGYDVFITLDNLRRPESSDLVVQIMESLPYTATTRFMGTRMLYKQSDSMWEAARETAAWIRANKQTL